MLGYVRAESEMCAGCYLTPHLPSQLVLDLAVDALKLSGEVRDKRFQRAFAAVDDPPELGALRTAQAFIGKPDPGLNDVTPPQTGALVLDIDWSIWHALDPLGVPHLLR